MSFIIKEILVNSSDNIHTLNGKIYIPDGEIKAIFQVVHGMCEHIERYDGFMSYLAENGYLAFAYDHLGHGKTAKSDDELGFISSNNGWKYLVNDVTVFANAVLNLYPNIPLYLFGHSMGSFIARLAAEKKPEKYEKIIICGTAGKNPLAKIGLALATVIKKVKGEKYISKLIDDMAFGAYNKRFSGETDYEWLTNDREIINKYSNDKFCTFKFTASAMHDLINLISMCNRNEWFVNIAGKMPIFLIAGSDDPVGNYGKGVKEVFEKLKKNNANVKLKLYPDCRHEILNDHCKNEVLSDILNFIK